MDQPTPDQLQSNKNTRNAYTIVFLCLLVAFLAFTLHSNRATNSDFIKVNRLADSLEIESRASANREQMLKDQIGKITDTITIIEKTQVLRYENYIQQSYNFRPDSTIEPYFKRAEAEFDSLWQAGFFARK